MSDGPNAANARWLSETELRAWLPFSATMMALTSALETQLRRDAKLSLFGYFVLAGLSEAPDRTMTMTHVALLASGSLSRVSHAVSALENRGWVTRRPDPEDGRITLVTLTDAGHQKVTESSPGHVETVRRLVIDPLTPQQLRQLGRASDVILAELNTTGERPLWEDRLRG
jgi:DNA-binding MarR family transcriptional regulator